MGDSAVLDDDDMAAEAQLDDDVRGETPESTDSTPEADATAEASQEPAQPQKRKGGRKPIYATSEERKQRNRQAQAAFRERRTEYIKQLEATIKHNEETLATLQQSHRTAADECLMLRYKNSLLERILLEKGIDVQAELQIKTGSPVLGPGFAQSPSTISQSSQPPLQRAAIQRQYARRSGAQGFPPKLAPSQTNPDGFPTASPQGHPTPSSHASSPTNVQARSPTAMHQGGMTPPSAALLAQQQQVQSFGRQQQPQHGSNLYPINPASAHRAATIQYQNNPAALSGHQTNNQQFLNVSSGNTSMTMEGVSAGPSAAAAYYPSPFQKHIDQLEQEYDTQQANSMLEQPDHDPDHASDPGPGLQGAYQQQFGDPSTASNPGDDFYGQSMGMSTGANTSYARQLPQMGQPSLHGQAQGLGQVTQSPGNDGLNGVSFDAMGQVIDPNDPMLDADPFGLSASMHYPTSYSAMDHQQRQQPGQQR